MLKRNAVNIQRNIHNTFLRSVACLFTGAGIFIRNISLSRISEISDSSSEWRFLIPVQIIGYNHSMVVVRAIVLRPRSEKIHTCIGVIVDLVIRFTSRNDLVTHVHDQSRELFLVHENTTSSFYLRITYITCNYSLSYFLTLLGRRERDWWNRL